MDEAFARSTGFINPNYTFGEGVCVITDPEHLLFSRGAVEVFRYDSEGDRFHDASSLANAYNNNNNDKIITSFDKHNDNTSLYNHFQNKMMNNEIHDLIDNPFFHYISKKIMGVVSCFSTSSDRGGQNDVF